MAPSRSRRGSYRIHPGTCHSLSHHQLVLLAASGSASRMRRPNRVSSSLDGTVSVVLRELHGVLAISTLVWRRSSPFWPSIGLHGAFVDGPRRLQPPDGLPDLRPTRKQRKTALRFRYRPAHSAKS